MVVTFFKSNRNNIRQAFGYLLDDRVEQKTSRILAGDVAESVKIADTTNNKIKYYSGVLSFKENPNFLSLKKKYEIIDAFEKTMIPDESLREKLNWTWIEHSDKGRLELNFVLNTKFDDVEGKIKPETFNFFHRHNQTRLSVFQDFIDTKYGCASAKDGKPSLELLKTKKFNKEKNNTNLNDYIDNIILKNPKLKNRDDLLNHLRTNESDTIAITRASKNFFSITKIGEKKPTRFTIKNDINLDSYREKLINNQIGLQNSKISADFNAIKEKLDELNKITAIKMRGKYYDEQHSTSSNQYIENLRKKAADLDIDRRSFAVSDEKIRRGRNSDGRDGTDVSGSLISSSTKLAEFAFKIKQEQYIGRKIESFGEQVAQLGDGVGDISRSVSRSVKFTRIAGGAVERIEADGLAKKVGREARFNNLIEKYNSDKNELKSECYEKKKEIFKTRIQLQKCGNRINRIKTEMGEIVDANARGTASHQPLDQMSEDEFIKWFNNELLRYVNENEAAARASRQRMMSLREELMKLQKKRDELNKYYRSSNIDFSKLSERREKLYEELQSDIEQLSQQPKKTRRRDGVSKYKIVKIWFQVIDL